MEIELGKPLFIRGGKKIILTEEDTMLRKRAEKIVEFMDKAEQEVRLSDDDITGTIHIVAGETYAMELIARTAKKLNKQYQNIKHIQCRQCGRFGAS